MRSAIIMAVFLLSGCVNVDAPGGTATGEGAFVQNECDQPVVVTTGSTTALAIADLEQLTRSTQVVVLQSGERISMAESATMSPGERRFVSSPYPAHLDPPERWAIVAQLEDGTIVTAEHSADVIAASDSLSFLADCAAFGQPVADGRSE